MKSAVEFPKVVDKKKDKIKQKDMPNKLNSNKKILPKINPKVGS